MSQEIAQKDLSLSKPPSLKEVADALKGLPHAIAEMARGLSFMRKIVVLEKENPGTYRTIRSSVKAKLFGDSEYAIKTIDESRRFRLECYEALERLKWVL